MRLIIKLQCIESSRYEMHYHYHLQSFIYALLRGSKYDVHNKIEYKFFCFSNIFPVKDLVINDLRTLVISSPDRKFVSFLYDMVNHYKNTEKLVRIGYMKFRIDSFYTFDLRLPDDLSFSLITGTPIIIRISREKYQAYGIRPKQDYDYIYWRSEYPLDLFTIHLKNNLQKKFSSYFGADDHLGQHISELFNKFKFKKQISTRLFINNSEQIIIGTLWEFIFEGWGDKKLIEFALDVGLGERNPLGFGFMNLIY